MSFYRVNDTGILFSHDGPMRVDFGSVVEPPALTPIPLDARLVATGHSIVDGVIKWPWSGVIIDAGLTPAVWSGTGAYASAQYRWENSASIGDGVRALMEAPGASYDLFLGIEAGGGTWEGRTSVREHILYSEGYLHALRWHNLAASTGAQTFYANFWRNDPAELFDAAWRGVQDAEQVLWDGIIDHVNANRDAGTPEIRLVPWGQVFCAVYDAIEAGAVTGITMGDLFSDDIHVSANLGTWVQLATMLAVMYQRHPDQLSNVVSRQFSGTLAIDAGLAAQLRPVIWATCLATARTGLAP